MLDEVGRNWFSIGLGAAFVIAMCFNFVLLKTDKSDIGFSGLLFLLTLIFFLIAFSFLVAASTPGIEIKVAVAIVDAFVLLGGKLFTPHFLDYIGDDGKSIPLSKRRAIDPPK